MRPFYQRPLTVQERSITRWLIDHASCDESEKGEYFAQLEEATVVGMCSCGCASVDFAISGLKSDPSAPLDPFGDFITKDQRFGVFVFSRQNRLAGIEIYSLQGDEAGSVFPSFEELVPMKTEANQFSERAQAPVAD